ncbi:TetR family transcriptional regulator [[Actinomadura] parvosata]|uniref:TetR family transcriptional regulator n=1 Tax=[Actinomadura] parvosata TaxID=1955412 RepID=UPI001646A044
MTTQLIELQSRKAARILDSARELVAEHGVRKVTVSEIAAAAGSARAPSTCTGRPRRTSSSACSPASCSPSSTRSSPASPQTPPPSCRTAWPRC